jgi:hypothetical protein
MEYLIPLVLVLLLVAGFVTFMVLNATKKSGPAATGDDAPGIGKDDTPLGDTREHSGVQDGEGRTVDGVEGGRGAEREEPAGPASERLANRDA